MDTMVNKTMLTSKWESSCWEKHVQLHEKKSKYQLASINFIYKGVHIKTARQQPTMNNSPPDTPNVLILTLVSPYLLPLHLDICNYQWVHLSDVLSLQLLHTFLTDNTGIAAWRQQKNAIQLLDLRCMCCYLLMYILGRIMRRKRISLLFWCITWLLTHKKCLVLFLFMEIWINIDIIYAPHNGYWEKYFWPNIWTF